MKNWLINYTLINKQCPFYGVFLVKEKKAVSIEAGYFRNYPSLSPELPFTGQGVHGTRGPSSLH